jgi:hypothetical protein
MKPEILMTLLLSIIAASKAEEIETGNIRRMAFKGGTTATVRPDCLLPIHLRWWFIISLT